VDHQYDAAFWRGLVREYGPNPMDVYRATGLLPPIAGGAETVNPHGYNETADILQRTVDGVPLDDLYNEFNATLQLLNAQRAPLVERLTFPVTTPFEQVMPIVADEFEEADEYGQPKGIRLGQPWTMGYPLRYYDLGIRYTFRFLGRAPASQIRALHNSALEADQRLVMRTILTRLFDNTTTTATLEDTGTVVNVYPFYNGDVTALPVAPPDWKSFTHTTTHTHYVTSGGATVVSGDLDDMYDHIYHHGYTQGGTDIFLLCNRALGNVIRKFKVSAGDGYDFIPAANTPAATFLGTLVGSLPTSSGSAPNTFPGFLGDYGPIHVVIEDYIPTGYMVMLASGGKFADRNPIGLRDHENAALRGLKLIPEFERYPLREAFYHHPLGAGVRHGAAGVVMQVTASATYVIPSLVLGGPGGR
jgi:hypothetical protein